MTTHPCPPPLRHLGAALAIGAFALCCTGFPGTASASSSENTTVSGAAASLPSDIPSNGEYTMGNFTFLIPDWLECDKYETKDDGEISASWSNISSDAIGKVAVLYMSQDVNISNASMLALYANALLPVIIPDSATPSRDIEVMTNASGSQIAIGLYETNTKDLGMSLSLSIPIVAAVTADSEGNLIFFLCTCLGDDSVVEDVVSVIDSVHGGIQDASNSRDSSRSLSSQSYTLGAGDYEIGYDIAPGRYDIHCISGSGNVWSYDKDGSLGLNEIMAAPTESSFGIEDFSGLNLEKGGELHISGTVKIVLQPR